MAGFGARQRLAVDGHLRTQLLEHLVADAAHQLEVVDALELAVLLAVLDDGLRLGRADALQARELGRRGGVDVDRRRFGAGGVRRSSSSATSTPVTIG